MDLQMLTNQLKRDLHELKEKYEQNSPPKNRRDHSFFAVVKQETTPIYHLLDQWETLALSFVKQRRVNVHPHQVTSTKENMELLLMHSYYIDVKKKRYMELYQSIGYVLDQLLDELS